jgi:Xaa-Pro aminopeptidase
LNTKSVDRLEPGNVVTIEPGIYLRGETGARWENTVLVKENGYDVLT